MNRLNEMDLSKAFISYELNSKLNKATTSVELMDLLLLARDYGVKGEFIKVVMERLKRVRFIEKYGISITKMDNLYTEAREKVLSGEWSMEDAIEWLANRGVPLELLGD